MVNPKAAQPQRISPISARVFLVTKNKVSETNLSESLSQMKRSKINLPELLHRKNHQKDVSACKSLDVQQVQVIKQKEKEMVPIPVSDRNVSTNQLQVTPKKSNSFTTIEDPSLLKIFKSSPQFLPDIKHAIINNDSIKEGEKLFCWLIHPMGLSEFNTTIWEKAPVLIARKCPTYYGELLSIAAIDQMLYENRVEFGRSIEITLCVDGVHENCDPEGRAMPPKVWDLYRDGCSIRLLNPQTFLPSVHLMIATLQEYFQCMTKANVYLTPPNSQGSAPHHENIELFVLQIEGL